MAVDSSGATITGNTIEDNQYAGVVFDLAWWDSDEDGVAQLGLTGNTIRGHNNRRQIISQSIPEGADVDGFAALHAANGLLAPRTPGGVVVERSEPPPPAKPKRKRFTSAVVRAPCSATVMVAATTSRVTFPTA